MDISDEIKIVCPKCKRETTIPRSVILYTCLCETEYRIIILPNGNTTRITTEQTERTNKSQD